MTIRIKYLDVLKAFAIIAVVLYHAGFMTYGYLGVDLFLVISGYLTTRSLSSKMLTPDSGGGISYLKFELSRIERLLPLLLVAGIVCMVAGYYLMLPDEYENLADSVIATNFFANNILGAITTDYWDVSAEFKPLMHTWYVGVLMQFYIVYPVLFFFARLVKQNPKKSLLTILATLGVLSVLTYFGTTDILTRFYFLHTRFFEFAVGGIVALIYQPNEDKAFNKYFVYICYVFLLILIAVNIALIPSNIRLVAVVALTAVLISSQNVLENNISGNKLLAAIGAASFSIFIWHQILYAFCRYSITYKFTLSVFIILMLLTALLSWLSYTFVEQKTTMFLKTKKVKRSFYVILIALFGLLNAYAAKIYLDAGVVRDIPELYVSMQNKHRGMHAEYVDRAYQYDRPFSTKKRHWYVIGDSFGRDFVNVILESPVADSVEVSYSYILDYKQNVDRFRNADIVFFAIMGLKKEKVTELENSCIANGLKTNQLVVVGEKNFGASNGQIYAKRNDVDYFDLFVDVEDRDRYIDDNRRYAEFYGDRFLDLMSFVTNDNNMVRVFTPDHHYISADCRHLSKGGAKYYGQLINWRCYLD